jgi:outer membrane protein assembly factor BamB
MLMPTHARRIAVLVAAVTTASGLLHAQGRGGGAWTTSGGDAQRSAWVRTDPRISKEGIAKAPLQLLWKRQLEKPAGQRSLSQPVLLPNIISYKGFKALAFFGGANTVYSLDYDLNKMFWQRTLGASSGAGAACAAGPVSVSRSTPVGPPAPGGRGGGFGGGRGGGNNVYAVSSTGMVHALNPQTGDDANPPAKFTGGAATIAGAVFIDNVVYAAAVETCGSVASGVYAVDLTDNKNAVTSWDAKGALIAGALGPAFGADGTVFVATGASAGDATFANAIVALEAKTLTAKDWFTASTPFTSSPIVFTQDGQTRVAAANADGSLYVLDAATLGGSDHKTPLAKSAAPAAAKSGNFIAGALTTWEGEGSSRWIAMPARDGIAAFRLPAGNTPVPEQVWTSTGVAAPGAPIVLNGVVFVVSNGEAVAGARVQRKPSVLYALDAATGKALWNSGNAMSSFVPGVPLSAGDGQVYVVTADGMLYAFGVPLEH